MATYTTEQVMSLTGLNRLEVYQCANRYGWSTGIDKPSHKQKRYDATKVDRYILARSITEQARMHLKYSKGNRLLWPVTTCPECHSAASYIFGMSIICESGHFTQR